MLELSPNNLSLDQQGIEKSFNELLVGLPGNREIEFNRRRVSNKQASKKAMFRTFLIGVVLMYVAYQLIIWAETTEWGNLLEFIRENG